MLTTTAGLVLLLVGFFSGIPLGLVLLTVGYVGFALIHPHGFTAATAMASACGAPIGSRWSRDAFRSP